MSEPGERLAKVEGKVENMETILNRHLSDCQYAQRRLAIRVVRLEIQNYIAIGGLLVIGWLINKASDKIIALLGA